MDLNVSKCIKYFNYKVHKLKGIFYTAYIAIAGCNYSMRICWNTTTLQKKRKRKFLHWRIFIFFFWKVTICKTPFFFLVRSVTLGPFLSARFFVCLAGCFLCLFFRSFLDLTHAVHEHAVTISLSSHSCQPFRVWKMLFTGSRWPLFTHNLSFPSSTEDPVSWGQKHGQVIPLRTECRSFLLLLNLHI